LEIELVNFLSVGNLLLGVGRPALKTIRCHLDGEVSFELADHEVVLFQSPEHCSLLVEFEIAQALFRSGFVDRLKAVRSGHELWAN